MIIRKTFRFEASHVLPKHPGKCSRLHGHSWVLHVSVAGSINPDTGFVMDYAEISEVVKPLVEALDHHHLGQWDTRDAYKGGSYPVDSHFWSQWAVPGMNSQFYPSSENLLVWIGAKLSDLGLNWSQLELEETCTSRCTLYRHEFNMMIRVRS